MDFSTPHVLLPDEIADVFAVVGVVANVNLRFNPVVLLEGQCSRQTRKDALHILFKTPPTTKPAYPIFSIHAHRAGAISYSGTVMLISCLLREITVR